MIGTWVLMEGASVDGLGVVVVVGFGFWGLGGGVAPAAGEAAVLVASCWEREDSRASRVLARSSSSRSLAVISSGVMVVGRLGEEEEGFGG